MKLNMKKPNLQFRVISSLLLFIFLYNTSLFIIISEITISFYKQRGKEISMSEDIEKAELIVLSKSDLISGSLSFMWIEENEFRLNGEMYDVIKQSEDEEYYYFYCYHDIKEEKITEEYYKKSENSTSEDKNINHIRNIRFNYISEAAVEIPVAIGFNSLEIPLKVKSRLASLFEREVPTPPPRFQSV